MHRLSENQRRYLVAKTHVDEDEILKMEDAAINVNFLIRRSIPIANVRAAGFTPNELYSRGANDAQMLRVIGFDALDLLDARFRYDAICTYGSANVVAAFLVTAHDAVIFADVFAMRAFSLDCTQLLRLCCGCPVEAVAVLQQVKTLDGVPACVLLDTGIRGRQLADLGYDRHAVVIATQATDTELEKLEMSQTRYGGSAMWIRS